MFGWAVRHFFVIIERWLLTLLSFVKKIDLYISKFATRSSSVESAVNEFNFERFSDTVDEVSHANADFKSSINPTGICEITFFK